MARCPIQAKEYRQKHRRTFDGYITLVYGHQKQNSKERCHAAPNYSKDELKIWIQEQPSFKDLWNSWKDSNYDKMLRPSVDRIEDSEPYSIENIELKTWKENDSKERSIKKKKVNKLTIDGLLLCQYESIAKAGEENNMHSTGIGSVCNNRQETAGGFKWEFVT